MKLTEHVYQLSGVPYGTNSNSYAIDAGDCLILIDAGFSALQWDVMKESLRFWGLSGKPVTHVFFTHCHFDHAGNAYLAKQEGMVLLAGESDAQGIETGDERTIGYMFGREFKPCSVDGILADGKEYTIGNVTVRAIAVPGHSRGSYMFQVTDGGRSCLFMGDFIALGPKAPEDDVVVSLAWTGGPDFDRDSYLTSLEKATKLEPSVLCPGHYYPYYGDSRRIFRVAYEMGLQEL